MSTENNAANGRAVSTNKGSDGLKQTAASPGAIWGTIGNAANALGGLFPEPDNYQGRYGNLSAGLDAGYNGVADAVGQINPIAGGIMKLGALGTKALHSMGVGTSGMTRTDAFMDSSFMALTPFGLINALGAKKSDTMEADTQTLALGGDSYSGAADDVMDASEKSGKKYGMFSRKALGRANDEMAAAGRLQNNMASIMNKNKMLMDALANQQDMNNQQYQNMMNGTDWSAMPMSAKKGGILPSQYQIAHRVAYNHRKQHAKQEPIEYVPVIDTIDMFQNGGQMSLLPEGALHKDKHHIEEVRDDLKGEITHKGIPVVTIAKDGQQVEQVAEIEHSEWILSADLTEKVEKLRDKYNESDDAQEKQEFAIEAGKLIAEEMMENTDDRVGLIKQIKV